MLSIKPKGLPFLLGVSIQLLVFVACFESNSESNFEGQLQELQGNYVLESSTMFSEKTKKANDRLNLDLDGRISYNQLSEATLKIENNRFLLGSSGQLVHEMEFKLENNSVLIEKIYHYGGHKIDPAIEGVKNMKVYEYNLSNDELKLNDIGSHELDKLVYNTLLDRLKNGFSESTPLSLQIQQLELRKSFLDSFSNIKIDMYFRKKN